MKVVEIFKSIDGEGIRTGLPVTFIRLYGCNLRCVYCDTKYSFDGSPYIEMNIDDILAKVKELRVKRITLTGGEPLIHKNVDSLIKALLKQGYEINIETNGSIDLAPFDFIRNAEDSLGKLFFTVDYKSISSGMHKHNKLGNFRYLKEYDVLKFVVGSKEDLDDMKSIIDNYNLDGICHIYVSPIFGSIEPKELVEYVLENRLDNVVVQVQLHKIIWDPNKKGV